MVEYKVSWETTNINGQLATDIHPDAKFKINLGVAISFIKHPNGKIGFMLRIQGSYDHPYLWTDTNVEGGELRYTRQEIINQHHKHGWEEGPGTFSSLSSATTKIQEYINNAYNIVPFNTSPQDQKIIAGPFQDNDSFWLTIDQYNEINTTP